MGGSKYRCFDPKNRSVFVVFSFKNDIGLLIWAIKVKILVYYTPPGFFNIRIKVLNSDICCSVKGHYSAALSSPPQITILLFVPKGIQNLLTIPNSRLLLSLSPFLSLFVLLAGSVFSQDPSGLSANQQTLPD